MRRELEWVTASSARRRRHSIALPWLEVGDKVRVRSVMNQDWRDGVTEWAGRERRKALVCPLEE